MSDWQDETRRRKAEWAMRRAMNEAASRHQYFMRVEMDLPTLLAVCSQIQLAMRHPGKQAGTNVHRLGRAFIDTVKERMRDDGLRANAELLEMGDNPENDL